VKRALYYPFKKITDPYATNLLYDLWDEYLRPTLHSDGAHTVKPLVTNVSALSTQLHYASLEILVLKQIYLIREITQ